MEIPIPPESPHPERRLPRRAAGLRSKRMTRNYLLHLSLRPPFGGIVTLVRPLRLVDGGTSVGDRGCAVAARALSCTTRGSAPTTLPNPPQLALRQVASYT